MTTWIIIIQGRRLIKMCREYPRREPVARTEIEYFLCITYTYREFCWKIFLGKKILLYAISDIGWIFKHKIKKLVQSTDSIIFSTAAGYTAPTLHGNIFPLGSMEQFYVQLLFLVSFTRSWDRTKVSRKLIILSCIWK